MTCCHGLFMLLHVESGDSDNEASSSKKKKKNTCTLVWEVSSNVSTTVDMRYKLHVFLLHEILTLK